MPRVRPVGFACSGGPGREKVLKREAAKKRIPFPITSVDTSQYGLVPTLIAEFDRVLGGGFNVNSTILVSGDPGIGKSTLLLQALYRLAEKSKTCLYVTGEESPRQIN